MNEHSSFFRAATERFYVALARSLSPLPNFRGKVRAGLAWHRMLRLRGRHIHTDVTLTRPLKYRMRLDLQCAHERMGLLMGGYEPEVPEFLAQSYPGQGYVLDIGANIGLISIPLALLLSRRFPGSQPHVWSIEPVKSNYEALRRNIRANDLEQSISVLECCIGDTEGTIGIHVEGNLRTGEGTGTAKILPTGFPDLVRIPVPLATLDTLISSGQLPADCALIKIDCDGFDYNVLRGARSLLTSARPVVFGEFMAVEMATHGQTHADVVQFMRGFDYAAFRKTSTLPLRFTVFSPDNPVESDLLFVPRESVERLAWCMDGRGLPAATAPAAVN